MTVVFPDQDDGGLGTLLIPNTVGVIQGAQHEVHARALVDYLLSPEVEATLAQARSAQVPLRGGTARASWIPDVIRTPDVTWADVADAFTAAREYVETTFLAE